MLSWGSNNRGATGLQPSYAMHFPPTYMDYFARYNITVIQVYFPPTGKLTSYMYTSLLLSWTTLPDTILRLYRYTSLLHGVLYQIQYHSYTGIQGFPEKLL